MNKTNLITQIKLCKKLLTKIPYSNHITITPHTPTHIITHAEEINILTHVSHPLNNILSVSDNTAILLSYFRNNILHLFTTSS